MGSFCSIDSTQPSKKHTSGEAVTPVRHHSNGTTPRSIAVTPANTGHVVFKTTQIVLNRVLALQVTAINF